jgi:hypothetical protein
MFVTSRVWVTRQVPFLFSFLPLFGSLLPRLWLSGVISDVSGQSATELGLCLTFWSPSDPPFTWPPGIFLPPGWQVSDYDRDLLDDIFYKLSGAT